MNADDTAAMRLRVLREAAQIATVGGREFAPVVPGLLVEVLDELERLQAIEQRARDERGITICGEPNEIQLAAARILGEPS